jgi:Flp pilus assembly protein TadG
MPPPQLPPDLPCPEDRNDPGGPSRLNSRNDDTGSATVEVTIVMPIVMLLLLLVVQAGIYFHTRAVATTAANKGVDALRVADGTPAAGRNATEQFLARHAPALDQRNVEVARTSERAEVTVTGTVDSLLFGIDLFPIQVSETAPIEQVTP